MPEKPRTADEFVHGLAGIYSDRVFCHARNLMSSLPDNPELGSANVRQSPVDRYGEGIRKISV